MMGFIQKSYLVLWDYKLFEQKIYTFSHLLIDFCTLLSTYDNYLRNYGIDLILDVPKQ